MRLGSDVVVWFEIHDFADELNDFLKFGQGFGDKMLVI